MAEIFRARHPAHFGHVEDEPVGHYLRVRCTTCGEVVNYREEEIGRLRY